MVGEVHGTKKIPKILFEILDKIKDEKIVFCLEIPEQAEDELCLYLNGKLKESEFLSSPYISDAVQDKRITANVLELCRGLYSKGVIIKGLEDYNLLKVNERDRVMVENFIKIIDTIKADKYFVYVGNAHTLDKQIRMGNFVVNPLKLYLPKDMLNRVLTIQFENSEDEKIEHDTRTRTIRYKLNLV